VRELRPLLWKGRELLILDQRALPMSRRFVRCSTVQEVARAIREMAIRGAPALGVASAYGMALALLGFRGDREEALRRAAEAGQLLIATRPTAYNIRWAVERVLRGLREREGDPFEAALQEAQAIEGEDYEACRRMGELGAALLEDGDNVLTHCKRA